MKPGVLVISHGSREAEWVRLVDEAVAAVSSSDAVRRSTSEQLENGREVRKKLTIGGVPVPVVSSFLEIVEGRLIQDGIDQLEAEGITDLYVLPFFVSSGSTHVDDIAQAFGQPPVSMRREGELERFRWHADTRIHFGQPINDDEAIAELLHANIRELIETPERERLLLVAHGSREAGFYGRWREGMTLLAERMRELGGFAGADIAMLLPNQAACVMKAVQRKRPDEAIIVVPLFLSDGYFTRTVIPMRLDGLIYRYNGRAMLPHPCVTRWMERQINEWLVGLHIGHD
ncbi:hypothetical protein Back11_39660 [Paenibacillus baekrokdamisoli]|uniref:Uncharacterized protein n=1 Tax=Paenibacillus baekrokdamisoli TaxID=1712516 RepID=A0A3G9J9V5_9BACL|nr:CbiX/SirB N-terminal domain-containing protein [Paenibacillus baekrokdamisoli]MBB3068337.1 sirohydrochlorin ferrochelatase [Paenibacillus baekrokdamisoli]BBH22621.1 hypothetical protein Back11_39660 [Paenibacillus baekrokdamisoli]